MTSTLRLLRLAVAATAALACLPAWAGIQRCVGANGAVTFTDQGCPAAADAKHAPAADDGELLPPDPANKTAAAPGAAHPAAGTAADPPAAGTAAKK